MARTSHDRHFPVRPNLDQLKHQAKDLLRAIRQGDPAAIAELRKHHPKPGTEPADAKLADAQAALARSYGSAKLAASGHCLPYDRRDLARRC